MPILPPSYFSTWYTFTDGNYYRLIQSWSESEDEDVRPIKLLQGDGGTHVMDIGGVKWTSNIKSPVVIFESNGSAQMSNIFDLLKHSFRIVQSPYYTTDVNYILKSAKVTIAPSGVDCDLNYWADIEGAFRPIYDMPYDFIARKARFYDTFFTVLDDEVTQSYQILDGSIDFEISLSENYFINQGTQVPYFGVMGYHIKGSLNVLVNAEQNGFDGIRATRQPSNVLNIVNALTTLSVGGVELSLGQGQVRGKITRTMAADQPVKASIGFDTYTSRNLLV